MSYCVLGVQGMVLSPETPDPMGRVRLGINEKDEPLLEQICHGFSGFGLRVRGSWEGFGCAAGPCGLG